MRPQALIVAFTSTPARSPGSAPLQHDHSRSSLPTALPVVYLLKDRAAVTSTCSLHPSSAWPSAPPSDHATQLLVQSHTLTPLSLCWKPLPLDPPRPPHNLTDRNPFPLLLLALWSRAPPLRCPVLRQPIGVERGDSHAEESIPLPPSLPHPLHTLSLSSTRPLGCCCWWISPPLCPSSTPPPPSRCTRPCSTQPHPPPAPTCPPPPSSPHSTLHLSIIAHNPTSSTPLYVLLQSAVLHPSNVEAVIETITQRASWRWRTTRRRSSRWATPVALPVTPAVQQATRRRGRRAPRSWRRTMGRWVPAVGDEGGVGCGELPPAAASSAVLPRPHARRCAAPALVLLTDNVLPLSTSLSSHDSILALLLRRSIPLSLLQLTSSSPASSFSFGYVPDTEIVRYATRVTGGLFARDRRRLEELLDRARGGVERDGAELSSSEAGHVQGVGTSKGQAEGGGLIGTLSGTSMRGPMASRVRLRGRLVPLRARYSPSPRTWQRPRPFRVGRSDPVPGDSSSLRLVPSGIRCHVSPLRLVGVPAPPAGARLRRYSMDVDVPRRAGVPTPRGLPRFRRTTARRAVCRC